MFKVIKLKIEGKVYVSEEEISTWNCSGCAFHYPDDSDNQCLKANASYDGFILGVDCRSMIFKEEIPLPIITKSYPVNQVVAAIITLQLDETIDLFSSVGMIEDYLEIKNDPELSEFLRLKEKFKNYDKVML